MFGYKQEFGYLRRGKPIYYRELFEGGDADGVEMGPNGLRLEDEQQDVEIVSTAHTLTESGRKWVHPYGNPEEGNLILITFADQGAAVTFIEYGEVVPELLIEDESDWPMVRIYAITKDNQPTPGETHDLVVSTAATTVGAISFTKIKGVSQEILDDLTKIIKANTYVASGTSISTNITTQEDNSFILDAVVFRDRLNSNPGSGQTLLFRGTFSSPRSAGASYKTLATAGQTSMSWSGGTGGTNRIRQLVVAIPPGFARKPSGTYTPPPIDATILPSAPRIRFNTDTPEGTSITVEYACTVDDETPPETWTAVNDGDRLTIDNDYLWLRYTLETEDTSATPTLLSLWIE